MRTSSSARPFVKRTAFASLKSFFIGLGKVQDEDSGQITGFAKVTKPYVLRDGAAKGHRKCSLSSFAHTFCIADVSDSLQNLILQHSNIDTFLKHYLDQRTNADLSKTHRGIKLEKELIRFTPSISRSIDHRRPWKLTPEQSASVNHLPSIVRLAQGAKELSRAIEDSRSEEKYRETDRRLRNQKQRQRRLLLVQIVDRFKKEQPAIKSERKVVNEDMHVTLKRSDQITLEHLLLILAILTLPETTTERELQRGSRCNGIEEGRSSCHVRRSRPARGAIPTIVTVEDYAPSKLDIGLSQGDHVDQDRQEADYVAYVLATRRCRFA